MRIARHAKTNQLAAIKIISKLSLATSHVTLAGLADQVEREMLAVEREIVIMKLLNHPNIVHLYDVWETSSHVYLVLEYTQGGELLDYICKQGPLSKREAVKYFRQIIDAVDYLHRFNIAHRDIKLENILLDKNRNIKITDFGTAAWQIDFSGAMDLMKTSCGSPHFAAPEVIRGEAYVGSAADIWSCGIILYAMLTARLPFDLPELQDKVIAGKYTIPSFVDPFAQNLIKRMLTVDVVKRITMPEIFLHPFVKHHPAKSAVRTLPALDETARSLKSKSCIDPDAFANLRALWRNTSDEDLLRSLLNDDRNWQKGIYQLLVNYRANRNTGDGAFPGERAKQPTRGNGFSEHKPKATPLAVSGQCDSRQFLTPACSEEYIPPGADLATPRKAHGRPHCPTPTRATYLDDMSFGSKEVVRMVPNSRILQQTSGETASDIVKWNRDRPLPPVPPSTIDPNSTISSSRVESEPLVFSLGHNYPGVTHSAVVPQGAFQPQFTKLRTKIRGHHTTDNAQEENGTISDDNGFVYIPMSSSLKNIGTNEQYAIEQKMGKPEDLVHRQHAVRPVLQKQSFQQLQVQTQSDSHYRSDDGEGPKHIWLNKIFKVRSSYLTKHTFYSIWDIITTRNACRRLLMNMDIHVQVLHQEQESFVKHGEDSSIVMKCEMDKMEDPSGILGIMKPTKFRVELTRSSERTRVRLVEPGERVGDVDGEVERVVVALIYEKGSGESFREIVRRLKGEWTLEDGGTVEVL